MVETKKEGEKQKTPIKTEKKVANKTTTKKQKPTLTMTSVKRTGFAEDIAEALGITSYEFLIIKRNFNIKDTTSITTEQMKEYYKELFN